MEEAMEGGNLGHYQEKLRKFPNMRSKPQTLLIVQLLMGINVRVLLTLVLLIFGGIFYIGARTSPVIVFVLLFASSASCCQYFSQNGYYQRTKAPQKWPRCIFSWNQVFSAMILSNEI